MWIGGHMGQMRISPNDPIFFLLHSYIDYLWEKWRTQVQTAQQRENDYPTDDKSCNSFHYRVRA
jgi:tyrosinase